MGSYRGFGQCSKISRELLNIREVNAMVRFLFVQDDPEFGIKCLKLAIRLWTTHLKNVQDRRNLRFHLVCLTHGETELREGKSLPQSS